MAHHIRHHQARFFFLAAFLHLTLYDSKPPTILYEFRLMDIKPPTRIHYTRGL
jgi:hypothetical protein